MTMAVQTTLFGKKIDNRKVWNIYRYPTTKYEQFIERYYGRNSSRTTRSKSELVRDGQVRFLFYSL